MCIDRYELQWMWKFDLVFRFILFLKVTHKPCSDAMETVYKHVAGAQWPAIFCPLYVYNISTGTIGLTCLIDACACYQVAGKQTQVCPMQMLVQSVLHSQRGGGERVRQVSLYASCVPLPSAFGLIFP